MFGEEVCKVLLTGDFSQLDLACADGLLDPQSLGIEVAKQGFAFYLAGFASYDVVYGSLGGVFALLFWVYLSANILLFGAEVAAELPHVLREEPRHGHAGATEANWRGSLLAVLRGLVLAPGEQVGPALPEHPADGDPPER